MYNRYLYDGLFQETIEYEMIMRIQNPDYAALIVRSYSILQKNSFFATTRFLFVKYRNRTVIEIGKYS